MHFRPISVSCNCSPKCLRFPYRLSTVAGLLITLEFIDFCVERSSNCTFDYVELREIWLSGDDDVMVHRGRLVGRLCGDGMTGVLHTTAAALSVKFSSDASIECRGFWAFYRQTRETSYFGSPYSSSTVGILS